MTDPSKDIGIDMWGNDVLDATYGDRAPEVRQLISDAAAGDPGEQNEPAMCWCGKGYVGHDPSHAAGPPVTTAEIRIAAGVVQDPLLQALAEHEQMAGDVIEQSESRGRNVSPTPLPVAIIYPSRTGGQAPHVVTLALWHCTCEAAVLGNRECWAITEAKRLFEGAR